ncbi:MAG: glycine zipper domain-containing protein [Pseudomonadota bacterium]
MRRVTLVRVTALAVAGGFGLGLLAGCAPLTSEVQKRPATATGAVLGGAGGATVGGLIGGTQGAVIGGLLGALGGGVIGNYQEKQQAPRGQALADTGVQPGQQALSLQKVTARPQTVAPGGQVDIAMTYSLVTPQPNETATVREVRDLTYNGQTVGRMAVDRQRASGTWSTEVPVTLPETAAPGTYTVVASVNAEGMTDSQTSTFVVR